MSSTSLQRSLTFEFSVQGLEWFGVLGFKFLGSGFRAWGLGSRVQGSGCRGTYTSAPGVIQFEAEVVEKLQFSCHSQQNILLTSNGSFPKIGDPNIVP